MPSSIFINNKRRYRPNVYANVITDLNPSQGVSVGNIAIVGQFPSFKANTPALFNDPNDLLDYVGESEQDLKKIAPLMFSPLATVGSINSLTICNVAPNTQASHTNGGVKVNSLLWGNQRNLRVKIAQNTDGVTYDLEVIPSVGDGEIETGVGEGVVSTLSYTSALSETFNDITVEINATDLIIEARKNISNADIGNVTTLNALMEGYVSLKVLSNQTHQSQVTVIGLSASGSAQTEVISIPSTASANDIVLSTNQFSRIDTIQGTNVGNFVGILNVLFDIHTKPLTEISDFGLELTAITNLNNDYSGTFTVDLPDSTLKGVDLDLFTKASIFSADGTVKASFKSDVNSIVEWFKGSAYVSAERSNGTTPSPNSNSQRLTGGSSSIPTSDNWQSGLDAIKNKNINTVIPFTDDVAIHILTDKHATDSAQDLGLERNVWVGTSSNRTIQQAYAGWSKKLNSRNVAVVCQNVLTIDGLDLEPKFTACILAGVQGSTRIAEPLTRKLITKNLIDTVENFDRNEDAREAIKKGLVVLNDPLNAGFLRVERSVTTWLKDGNRIYSEVSANESVNSSIRELRSVLQDEVGTSITQGKTSRVKDVCATALNEQVNLGIIKAFKDLSVSISGDVANVTYSLSAVEPLNFIVVTANVQQ